MECTELSQRGQQLVKHVSQLEKQLQSRIRTPVLPSPASPQPDPALQNKLQQTLAEKRQLENRLSEQVHHCIHGVFIFLVNLCIQ